MPRCGFCGGSSCPKGNCNNKESIFAGQFSENNNFYNERGTINEFLHDVNTSSLASYASSSKRKRDNTDGFTQVGKNESKFTLQNNPPKIIKNNQKSLNLTKQALLNSTMSNSNLSTSNQFNSLNVEGQSRDSVNSENSFASTIKNDG